ncbi:MAG: ArsR family transcriptional regulator [Pseudomonadota bacterium]
MQPQSRLDSIPQPPPTRGRLLIRLLAEMQASCTVNGLRVFEGELDRAIIFMVVARESGALSPLSGGTAQTGCAQQAISINALAASMSRPFETVRRHTNALLDAGLCRRTPSGVMTPADVYQRPAIAGLFRMHHDTLVRLIEDMVTFDVPLPETRPQIVYDWHTGLAAAHDILLTGIEFHAAQFRSWLDMILLGTVLCANARPFTYDREITMAYAEFTRLPPDNLRAPVAASAIARVLGLPASTVQRRVNIMIESGQLQRRQGGLMVTQAALNHPPAVEDSRTATDHTRQIFTRLAAGGFRFDDPARCYIVGRPPLVDFS